MHAVFPSLSAQSRLPYLKKRSRSPYSCSRQHQLCRCHRVPTLPKLRGPLPSPPKLRGPLPGMAATPGFKSQHQSSSAAPFLIPPTISYTCQHSHIRAALLGCHSKSGQVWPHGMEPIFSKLSHRGYNQGELPPSYIWVEVTSIPLAQSKATAI